MTTIKRFLLLLFFLPVLAQAETTTPPPVLTTVEEWWSSSYTGPLCLPKESQRILEELRRQFRNSPKLAHLIPSFPRWFTLGKWLSLYSSRSAFFQNKANYDTFIQLAQNEELPLLLFASLQPQDQAGKAVEILCRLYAHNPRGVRNYPDLAVAFAVVYDQPFPQNWPHSQIAAGLSLPVQQTPEQLFDFFIQSHEKRKLLLDPSKLSVSQLKFVVDTPAPINELAWAQQNVRLQRSQFAQAFALVPYDAKRIPMRQFVWRNGPYTLANIFAKGGLCVDQAYFASVVGKAFGLPTLFFVGLGRDGGHAWFGYLKDEETWELDCGRYREQNYPVGQALDPQTWSVITDAELEFFSKGTERRANYLLARLLLNWALMNSNELFYNTALDSVIDMLPDSLDAWRAKAQAISKESLEEQRLFWKVWIKKFEEYPDLKEEGQTAMLKVLQQGGSNAVAENLLQNIIQENQYRRFDIGIDAATVSVFEHIKKKKWNEADRAFRGFAQKFQAKGGSYLFYKLVRPYVIALLNAKQNGMAQNAVRYAESRIRTQKGSILDQELHALRDQVNAPPASALQ
ncbi:MAG: hypothetical protein V1746_02900 [bacterium]